MREKKEKVSKKHTEHIDIFHFEWIVRVEVQKSGCWAHMTDDDQQYPKEINKKKTTHKKNETAEKRDFQIGFKHTISFVFVVVCVHMFCFCSLVFLF